MTCANSPSPSIGVLRRNGKIRFILETFIREEIDAYNAEAGFPTTGPLAKYRVPYPRTVLIGVQGSALETSSFSLDSFPVISVYAVTDTAEQTDTGSRAQMNTILAIEVVDDLDSANLQGSAMRATALSTIARDTLWKYIVDSDTDNKTGIISALPDTGTGGTPVKVREESTTVAVETTLQIISHVNGAQVYTINPLTAGAPYEPSLGPHGPLLAVQGVTTTTLAHGTSATLDAVEYAVSGVTLTLASIPAGQSFTVANHTAGTRYVAALGATGAQVTSANIRANVGDMWTVTGTHPETGVLFSCVIRWQ
jgi:hypothetical protein